MVMRLRVSGASLVKPSKALAAPTSSREANWLGLGLESGLGLVLGLWLGLGYGLGY